MMATVNGRIPLSLEGIERALNTGGTAQARKRYLASLRGRIAYFERHYRLPSELLQDALKSHKLQENLDVVKWGHAYETLRHLENGKQARLERPKKLPRSRASGTGQPSVRH